MNKDLLSSNKKFVNLHDNVGLTKIFQTCVVCLMSEEIKMVMTEKFKKIDDVLDQEVEEIKIDCEG